MKKGIILFITVLAFVPMSFAQKVGHVDLQAVTDSLPSMKDANKELEDYQAEQTKVLEDMAKALENDYQVFMQERDSLSPIIVGMKEENFMKRQQEIAFKQQQLEQDLQTLYTRLFTPIQSRLDKAVAIVAEKEGVVYVLEKTQLLYAGSGGINLTAQVREEMRKSEGSAGAGN